MRHPPQLACNIRTKPNDDGTFNAVVTVRRQKVRPSARRDKLIAFEFDTTHMLDGKKFRFVGKAFRKLSPEELRQERPLIAKP